MSILSYYLAYLTIISLLELRCFSKWSGDPEVIDYRSYYYKSIREKMSESLSANNCTIAGAALGFKYGDETADLQIKERHPSKELVNMWDINLKLNSKSAQKVFYHTNRVLCSTDRYRDFKKGFYKRAKGCFNYTAYNHLPRNKRPINKWHATLHPNHIRCDNQIVTNVCLIASKEPQLVPFQFRQLYSPPFIISAKNVIVARSGMIALPCGPFGLFASCEAAKCGINMTNLILILDFT